MHTTHLVRIAALLAATTLAVGPTVVEGQGRGNQGRAAESAGPSVTLSVSVKDRIVAFYADRPAAAVESLPPGIRRNLARGKPLPPGIAKKSVPAELRSRVEITEGFELVEVGLDVFLVEVATNVIHDVLMDVIR